MTNLAHNTQNDTRLQDFMSEVREYGRDEAAGDDALPKLALSFARAVYDEVIPADKYKEVFDEYAKAKGKKSVHDRDANSIKAQYSKLNQIGKAADLRSKLDFIDVLNRSCTIRERLYDTLGTKKGTIKPAYAFYVDVAREQLKQDVELSDDQIEALCLPAGVTREKTVEGELKRAQKILEDLISGEAKHGLKDQSPEVMVAAEQLNQRLAALMQQQQAREAIEKALAAGFELADDGTLRMPVKAAA